MKWAILTIVAAMAVFGLTLVHEVPYTPDDALACCAAGSSDFDWTCPTEGGTKECHLHLGIPRAEFENTMHQNVFRTGTVFSPSPVSFVSPSDHYVVTVAQHIDAETAGLSPYLKATAALWFVQCSVAYCYDSVLFGTENYWAFPCETLYLRQGDCEDTSVLLSSILEAMGFRTVLLDYEGHMAVGTEVEGATGKSFVLADGTYHYCESTATLPTMIGSCAPEGEPEHIWHTGHGNMGTDILNHAVSGYRYLFRSIFGI